MTLQDAQQLAWSFNRPNYKLFIEHAGIRQGPCGDYLLVVARLGEQQIFTDAEKAQWALVEWMAKSAKANDRYFTLTEDGSPKECDFATWAKQWPKNAKKTETKIACSPEIEATICFIGHAASSQHMDEEMKLWNVSFNNTAKNECFLGTNFKSFEEAKAFVVRYIAKGYPTSGFPLK